MIWGTSEGHRPIWSSNFVMRRTRFFGKLTLDRFDTLHSSSWCLAVRKLSVSRHWSARSFKFLFYLQLVRYWMPYHFPIMRDCRLGFKKTIFSVPSSIIRLKNHFELSSKKTAGISNLLSRGSLRVWFDFSAKDEMYGCPRSHLFTWMQLFLIGIGRILFLGYLWKMLRKCDAALPKWRYYCALFWKIPLNQVILMKSNLPDALLTDEFICIHLGYF